MAQNNSTSTVAHGENGASFEQSFLRLQEVVQKLSEGNLTLQEALESFEEGMGLADRCAQMLEEAELRIKQVSERSLRAGASALQEIDEAMRAAQGKGEPELISFEVETFEGTVFFEAAEETKGLGTRGKAKAPENGKSKLQNPKPKTQPHPFDPLFDEDD